MTASTSRYSPAVTDELDDWLNGTTSVTDRNDRHLTAATSTPTPELPPVTRTLADCPDLTPWAVDATNHGAHPAPLRSELLAAITEAIAAHPRSLQTEIGPSEIGHPCNRWLALFFAGAPRREQKPPWRPAVGTAVHEHFSAWLHRWNDLHGTRYLTDLTVYVGDLCPGRPVFGTLDALDVITGTVIDLKVPGPSQMKAHKTAAGGPERSPTYRIQTQLYGRGAGNAGFPVANVGILRVPAAGDLDDAIWTHEPYDEQTAVNALTRAGGIATMVDALGAQAIEMQPTTEHYCTGCQFYEANTTDLARACPGDAAGIAKRAKPPAHLNALAGN
jgi:hypothetical protein